MMLVLGACSSGEFKADHKYKIEPFAFTNQHNEEVSLGRFERRSMACAICILQIVQQFVDR